MADLFTRPIVLATANPKKVGELRAIFADVGLEIESLADLGTPTAEPDEIGTTFEQNATIKALDYARQTGRLCLADDSGLEVDALDGAPGVISSHYCTDGQETGMTRAERDLANNQRVLRELDRVPTADRSARFVCVMVLAAPPSPGGGGFQPPASIKATRRTGLRISASGDLPHWRLEGSTYFLTFRLKSGELTPEERTMVAEACSHWHGERWVLHLGVVMPDHVHLLARELPGHKLSDVLKGVKQFSARRVNQSRNTAGQVWQRETYDRIIRDQDELLEKAVYIESNPVRSGLCQKPGEYAWLLRQTELNERRLEASATGFVITTTRGTFEGAIGIPGDVPRGTNGFGYDPLFVVKPELRHTSAELDADTKNALSHRGQAARAMASAIAAMRGT